MTLEQVVEQINETINELRTAERFLREGDGDEVGEILDDSIIDLVRLRDTMTDTSQVISLTPEVLKVALHDAKVAHTQFEKDCGPDPDWEEWYAQYMHTHLSK